MSTEKASVLTASGPKTIYVYDLDFRLLGRIESWISLVWPERYNVYRNVQGAQLEVYASTDLLSLCRPDRYLWLAGSEHLMRICSAQTADHRLVLSARDAAYILDERICTKTLKDFRVETTLRQLVADMKPWPHLELGELANLPDTYTGEVGPGSLLDIIEQVCQELDFGFRLRFDAAEKKLLFELYLPLLDRNARYAPQYGNLTDLTYTESIADYKNVVTVVGGEATVTVGADDTEGYARRELVVDATSRKKASDQTQSEYLDSLKALGTQELAKHARLENFRFTPTDDITVGKVVAASLPGTDIRAAARITSITLTSQQGENSVTTEIGTPILRRKQ